MVCAFKLRMLSCSVINHSGDWGGISPVEEHTIRVIYLSPEIGALRCTNPVPHINTVADPSAARRFYMHHFYPRLSHERELVHVLHLSCVLNKSVTSDIWFGAFNRLVEAVLLC